MALTFEKVSGLRPGLQVTAPDAKGKVHTVALFDDEHASLSVRDKATPEDLAELLATDLPGRARTLFVAFNKKGLVTELPALRAFTAVENATFWRVAVGSAPFDLPNVRTLDLHDVGAIGPLGRAVPSLKTLKLGGGKTTALPEDLDLASGLEAIVMRDVGVKVLPAAVGRLAALRTLDVIGAVKMKKFPPSMATPLLSHLVLQDVGSDTTPMPDWIATLPALERLALGHVQQPRPAWLAEVRARVKSYAGPA